MPLFAFFLLTLQRKMPKGVGNWFETKNNTTDMKKSIILMLMLTVTMSMSAQRTLFGGNRQSKDADKSLYMQGAVPEENGKVVFTASFEAPGKSKADIFRAVSSWASLRFMAESENGMWNDEDYYKNLEYAAVKEADALSGRIVCFGDEEQVFSNRVLAKDYTRINYGLKIDIKDGKVDVKMDNIVYTYVLKDDPERIAAEDWITDKEAITKKGKLMRVSGKFRIKTIDLKNELFEEIATILK